MKAALFAVAALAIAADDALACDVSFGNASCVQWAPITGDVGADACVIAALEVERADDALNNIDRPRLPGNPIWTREFLHKLRNDALARQAKSCAMHAVDLR